MTGVLVTPLYAGALGILLLVLSGLVTAQRLKYRVALGDGGVPAVLQAVRVHANFTEYVPFALLLVLMLELTVAPTALLHGLGMALLLGRVAHAHGLSRTPDRSPGRFLGTLLTWGVILVASVALLMRTVL